VDSTSTRLRHFSSMFLKSKMPLYVVSRGGLYMVRPSDGKIINVFQNEDWMSKTPKEPKKKEY